MIWAMPGSQNLSDDTVLTGVGAHCWVSIPLSSTLSKMQRLHQMVYKLVPVYGNNI